MKILRSDPSEGNLIIRVVYTCIGYESLAFGADARPPPLGRDTALLLPSSFQKQM